MRFMIMWRPLGRQWALMHFQSGKMCISVWDADDSKKKMPVAVTMMMMMMLGRRSPTFFF